MVLAFLHPRLRRARLWRREEFRETLCAALRGLSATAAVAGRFRRLCAVYDGWMARAVFPCLRRFLSVYIVSPMTSSTSTVGSWGGGAAMGNLQTCDRRGSVGLQALGWRARYVCDSRPCIFVARGTGGPLPRRRLSLPWHETAGVRFAAFFWCTLDPVATGTGGPLPRHMLASSLA